MSIPPTARTNHAATASSDHPPRSGVKADEFDWAGLVANFIHPVKVDVIEALHYIDAPLSSTDLRKVFDNSLPLSNLSHHVTDLAKKGALVKVADRKVRGSVESFYELR